MLTELYLLDRAELATSAEELRNRAASFGEGLQLVNILKDAPRDAAEGRVYIPDDVELHAVLELTGRALTRADEYVELLRRSGTAPGLITFNAFIAGLARSNLRILAARGLGAKLSRSEVASVAAEVSRDFSLRRLLTRSGSRTPTDAPRSIIPVGCLLRARSYGNQERGGGSMRVFLTGATGFIGSHVARALMARNDSLCCLCRPTSHRADLEDLPIEWVVGELTDRDSLRRAMTGAELVFHCAADYRLYARDPAEIYRTNVDGTRNVLELAAELGVRRVIYTGSVGTLALGGPRPANENARAQLEDMVGDYKRSKFLAERVVESWIRTWPPHRGGEPVDAVLERPDGARTSDLKSHLCEGKNYDITYGHHRITLNVRRHLVAEFLHKFED